MRFKQSMGWGLVFVLLLQCAWAQEASKDIDSLSAEAGVQPGTNPNSFSYKLSNFWDSLSYSFTFNKNVKVQKGLQIARKHLWEVRTFSESKELDKAQKAQGEYSTWISKVKESIKTSSSEDPKEELEKNVQLNVELEKEDRLLETIKNDIASSSRLSSEEKEKAGKLLDKASENQEEVKHTAEGKKEKAQTKFKARFGLKEKELKEEVKKLESKSEVRSTPKKENEENETQREEEGDQGEKEKKEPIHSISSKHKEGNEDTEEKNESTHLNEKEEQFRKEFKIDLREKEQSKKDRGEDRKGKSKED